MLHPAIGWLLSLMTAVAPPDRLARAPQLPGYEESAEDKEERYASLASDLYEVAFDRELTPLFRGKHGRSMTAMLALAVAFHESGFAKDVDRGPCYRAKGYERRCDGGRAACVMQVEVGEGSTLDGWTKADLFADRQKCFRAGIKILRRSMHTCRDLPVSAQLSIYAGGACHVPAYQKKSRELYGQFRQFSARGPFVGLDEVLMPDALAMGENQGG